jgi:hypothetical protein
MIIQTVVASWDWYRRIKDQMQLKCSKKGVEDTLDGSVEAIPEFLIITTYIQIVFRHPTN